MNRPSNTPTAAPLARQDQAQIGYVMSQEQHAAPDLIKYGIAAERAGFATVWCSDHFQPWQDNQGHASLAWINLAALGAQTSRISFGTGVTCPSYRYRPAIVAQAFATLGLLYPGRVFLGVGTGEALNEQAATGEWEPYAERAARMTEAILLIRRLWTGEIVDYPGEYYTVEGAKLYCLPPQPVPIYVAASGKNSMRLAGEYGDGLITDTKSLQDAELMAAFRAGAQAAGKDPASLPIIVEQWAFVGDRAEVGQWANLWRFIPKAWEKYVNNPDPRAIQAQAEAEIELSEVSKDWAVSTDPAEHIKGLQKLIKAGASTIFVHSPQPDQERMIEFYGREVLPQLGRG